MSTSEDELISIFISMNNASADIPMSAYMPAIEKHIPSLLGMFLIPEYAGYKDAIFKIIPHLNKTSIHYFISPLLHCLNNPNSADFQKALGALQIIDKDILFPSIYFAFEYSWSDDMWIQGISLLMSTFKKCELRSYHKQVMNTFRRGNKSNCLDNSVIALMSIIASPEMDMIIPDMIERLAHDRTIEFKLELIDALLQFDRAAIESHRDTINAIYEQSSAAEKIALQPLL